MKSDFCMSETREPEHMKSHFVNCRICTFWACLLRHESGAKRVGKSERSISFFWRWFMIILQGKGGGSGLYRLGLD